MDTLSHRPNRSETIRTAKNDINELLHSNALKYTARIALGATAFGLVAHAMAGISGGNSDPTKYAPDHETTSVTLESGANIRHDPSVPKDETPIETVGEEMTIATPDGAYYATEYHNGQWVGVKATDIPDFDARNDNDGIVWVNVDAGKASANK